MTHATALELCKRLVDAKSPDVRIHQHKYSYTYNYRVNLTSGGMVIVDPKTCCILLYKNKDGELEFGNLHIYECRLMGSLKTYAESSLEVN